MTRCADFLAALRDRDLVQSKFKILLPVSIIGQCQILTRMLYPIPVAALVQLTLEAPEAPDKWKTLNVFRATHDTRHHPISMIPESAHAIHTSSLQFHHQLTKEIEVDSLSICGRA